MVDNSVSYLFSSQTATDQALQENDGRKIKIKRKKWKESGGGPSRAVENLARRDVIKLDRLRMFEKRNIVSDQTK